MKIDFHEQFNFKIKLPQFQTNYIARLYTLHILVMVKLWLKCSVCNKQITDFHSVASVSKEPRAGTQCPSACP